MTDSPPTDEMDVGHEAKRCDDSGRSFALGIHAGYMLAQHADEGCDDCSCGVADGETAKIRLGTDTDRGSLADFNEEFRHLLEWYFPAIEDDTLVSRVEICADDVPVAHVRE